MKEIIVLAHARAKAGKEEQLTKAFCAAVPPTHAEEGCLKYAFNQSTEDKHAFVMIERWSSKEALDQHLKTPHIQELFKKLPDLLERPIQIQIYHSVSAGGSPEKLL